VPFLLDTNSTPTLTQAALIRTNVYDFINGYIGQIVAGSPGDLKAVEIYLTVEKIMAIHDKRDEKEDIPRKYKMILDNHKAEKEQMVSIGDLYFGYYDSY